MTQEIDPRFFIPPNVAGVDYRLHVDPSSDSPDEASDTNVIIEYDIDGEEDFGNPDAAEDEERILPPDYITIVSQEARVTSGGMVIDVVIDVEDAPRVSQFEVRVTK